MPRPVTGGLRIRVFSPFSLEDIKQEYPSYGSGDVRYPAFELIQENGSPVTDFQYVSHKLYTGKPKLNGLPATYVESDDEAQTLEITLRDSMIQTKLVLTYTIYEELPVITRSAKFVCEGGKGILKTKKAKNEIKQKNSYNPNHGCNFQSFSYPASLL